MRQDLIFGSTTPVATSDLVDESSEQRERVLDALHGLREQAAFAEQIALARQRVGPTDRDADARLALLALLALAVDGFVEDHERVLAVAGREPPPERGALGGDAPRRADPAGARRVAPQRAPWVAPRRKPGRTPRRTCCRVHSAMSRRGCRDQ